SARTSEVAMNDELFAKWAADILGEFWRLESVPVFCFQALTVQSNRPFWRLGFGSMGRGTRIWKNLRRVRRIPWLGRPVDALSRSVMAFFTVRRSKCCALPW